jgi:ABC-type transport system involved in cytochrome c biogenesis permease subunit
MDWFTARHTFFVAVLLYGASAVYSIFLLRRGFTKDNWINYLLLLGGCALNTVAMFKRGFSLQRCPINNLFEASMFIAWTITASYLLIGLLPRLRFLAAFASPVLFGLGVFALMPQLDTPHAAKPVFTGGWSSLHAALILLSYGAFGLSSVASLMYLNQEHDLKFHKLRAVLSLMPPIQRLETIVMRLLLGGFGLLTAGLLIGAFALTLPPGTSYWTDAKVHWSLIVWLIYLTVLVMHWFFRQRGRRFAWSVIGSFAFVLFTFWGFSLISPIHNPMPGR